MPRFIYTPEMLSFLRDGYKKMRVPELTAAFNATFDQEKTTVAIKSTLTTHNFTCGRPVGFAKGEKISLLTPEQVDFVKHEYSNLSRKALHEALIKKFEVSVTFAQLVCFLKNHKIKSGRTGHYKKGNVPWTAGKAGLGIVKPNKGSFQVGSRPKNYRPVGSERISRDGYVEVKVSDTNPWESSASGYYRLKQILVWEAVHGPIPDGHCLRFVDGDRKNCKIENLILVTRAENCRLTLMGYGNLPTEIKPVAISLAKVDQAVFEKERVADK